MIEEWAVKPCVDKPSHFTGAYRDYTQEDIEWVVRQFEVNGAIVIAPFPGRGNINLHTYQVLAGKDEFLLQKVNSDVFTLPYRVMRAMIASINAQRKSLDAGMGDELWEPITLIPTRTGQPFLDLTDDHGPSVWRLMVRIGRSVSYKSLGEVRDREGMLDLAEQVGRGLAIYSDLTSSIDPSNIEGSLPGYRETDVYFRQFKSVLAGNRTLAEANAFLPEDPITREGVAQHFLIALSERDYKSRLNDPDLAPFMEMVKAAEPRAMGLWDALRDGEIRHTLIHGDTKIENFLFCSETGRVKGLVDLDTIMPFTWLADWGDMLRSMVNVAGEKERDLSKVVVDEDVYLAVARGFLGAAKEVTEREVAMMTWAVEAITLELGLRFLSDHLRGDTYFQLGAGDPPDLNKVRAMVQLTLFQRLVELSPRLNGALRGLR